MPSEEDVRGRRHEAIRAIVAAGTLARQSEVVEALRAQGFEVTQSSVSRDFADLGVEKVGGRYSLRAAGPLTGVRSVLTAGPHLIVLKTEVGAAPLVGVEIDRRGWTEVVGTVAGDDTIFVAVGGRAAQAALLRRLGGAA